MSISVFSCLTAFLWFDLALLLCTVLCRQNETLLRFDIWPAALLLAAGSVRLLCPVTLSSTRVVHSMVILPFMQAALRWRIPLFGATLGEALLAVWLVGAAVNLFKLALELRQNRQAVRRCVYLSDSRIEAIAHHALGEKAAASCRFLLTSEAPAPLMVGFLRPVFLLPAYLTGFTDEEVRYVICHEWQHFRYRSNCWKLLVESLICLLWWNPPVYLLRQELDQLMELICDRGVVRDAGREEKAAYLETIMKSLRSQQGRPAFSGRFAGSLSGSGKASEMKQRFQMVAKSGREHPGRILLCAVCLIFLLAASLLIVVQPFQVPAQEIFCEQGIVSFDAMPGSAYVKEDRNGRFVLHIFDIPCYTFDGVVYDLSALKVANRYIQLGQNTDSQNSLRIHYPNEGLIPTLCRTDTGELVPVHLPEGIGPSVSGRAFDKNECVKYYRYSNGGVLQQRIWSVTYCRWLAEWEDAVGYF